MATELTSTPPYERLGGRKAAALCTDARFMATVVPEVEGRGSPVPKAAPGREELTRSHSASRFLKSSSSTSTGFTQPAISLFACCLRAHGVRATPCHAIYTIESHNSGSFIVSKRPSTLSALCAWSSSQNPLFIRRSEQAWTFSLRACRHVLFGILQFLIAVFNCRLFTVDSDGTL